jgi:transcriptional regulator with GAF, ATPase, and Fis domain
MTCRILKVSGNDAMPVTPVFNSSVMQQLLRMVERVANHNATVLLVGETGAGKEVIAQQIHARSMRAKEALIDVNCGALPDHLVESELFGYDKGAFSGADHTKPGLFELANGGTLFLDEIGELDMKLQSKLLRVLDGNPYFRLGGKTKVSVDVRVIAATNRNLQEAVDAGTFRRDLFHRIAQFQLSIPPLRSRPEDILAIAEEILVAHRPAAWLTSSAQDALLRYNWPGNVRELRNVIVRAAALAEQDAIAGSDIDIPITGRVGGNSPGTSGPRSLDDVEKTAIMAALKRSGGNQGVAAELLGISRRTLVRKLKTYRESPSSVMGHMAPELQAYYRAALNGPVTLSVDGQQISGDGVNVSTTGMRIRNVSERPHEQARAEVSLLLPGTSTYVSINSTVIWSLTNSEAGVRFEESCPPALKAWLLEQQQLEGWSTAPEQVAVPV